MLRLVGRVDIKMGWPQTHVWWLRMKRDISASEILLSSEGPQPYAEKGSPQWGSVHPSEMKGYWKYRCPLKRPTQRLWLAGTHSGLRQKDSGRRTVC